MATAQVPLRAYDPDRVRGLIEMAVASHADPERVGRFLRAGAQVQMRREDGMVHLSLEFTATQPVTAAVRAAAWGVRAERPTPSDLGSTVELACVPVGVLGQPPQG